MTAPVASAGMLIRRPAAEGIWLEHSIEPRFVLDRFPDNHVADREDRP